MNQKYKEIFQLFVIENDRLKKDCKIQLLQQGKIIISHSIVYNIFASIIPVLAFLPTFISSIALCVVGIMKSKNDMVLVSILFLSCSISFAWWISFVNRNVTIDFNKEAFICRKFFFWLCEYKFSDLKEIICTDNYVNHIYTGTFFKLSFEENNAQAIFSYRTLTLPTKFKKENIETIKMVLNFIYINTRE
jgi:hypothetical protein